MRFVALPREDTETDNRCLSTSAKAASGHPTVPTTKIPVPGPPQWDSRIGSALAFAIGPGIGIDAEIVPAIGTALGLTIETG